MTSILTRRNFLRGLLAAPAIVAASNLMPVRGIVMAMPQDGIMLYSTAHPCSLREVTGYDAFGEMITQEVEIFEGCGGLVLGKPLRIITSISTQEAHP